MVSAFRRDGTVDAAWLGRLHRVLTAADKLGMVPIIQFFYCVFATGTGCCILLHAIGMSCHHLFGQNALFIDARLHPVADAQFPGIDPAAVPAAVTTMTKWLAALPLQNFLIEGEKPKAHFLQL